MKKYARIFLMVFIVAGLTSCSSHRYTVVDAPENPLTLYDALEIAQFKSNLNDANSLELAMGMFGGDADEAVDGVVEAFIDYMQEYMSS